MPQSAIAQVESAASTSLKLLTAFGNSNECINVMARSNGAATAGEHDVAKWTVPICSAEPTGWSCCWASACVATKATSNNALRFIQPSRWDYFAAKTSSTTCC